jgi:hypothetical protein
MNKSAVESRASKAFAPALTLPFIAILVNYVDRGNLSIAAPLLKDELGIFGGAIGLSFLGLFLVLHRHAVCERMARRPL